MLNASKETALTTLTNSVLCRDDRGQDIAEYAVMLGVILTIIVATIRMIGSHADNVFSSVGSAIQ
jgi:Flp pilus assembly pilin Flp